MVSVGGNLYSVPEATRRRVVEVHTLADEIRIFEDGTLIATHPVLEGRGRRRVAPGHRKFRVVVANATTTADATLITAHPGERVARRPRPRAPPLQSADHPASRADATPPRSTTQKQEPRSTRRPITDTPPTRELSSGTSRENSIGIDTVITTGTKSRGAIPPAPPPSSPLRPPPRAQRLAPGVKLVRMQPVAARDRTRHRIRSQALGDNLRLLLPAPPPPPLRPSQNLDPANDGLINWLTWITIHTRHPPEAPSSQPRPSRQRGLRAPLRACKIFRTAMGRLKVIAHWWRWGASDVGDQALPQYRDASGAFPILQRASQVGHIAAAGNSPAVAPPPPMRER